MHDKIKVIMDLMKDLQSEMEPSADDIDERLGRKKPGIEMVKIEGKMPMDKGVEKLEEKYGQDLDGDMEMGEDPEHKEMVLGEDEDESPEDKLKNRIMKMRG